MASTPPQCSITTNKPYQQHQQQQNQHQHHHHWKNHRQSHHQSRHKVSLTKPIPVPLSSPSSRNAPKPCATTDPNSSFPMPSLCPQKSELSHEFSCRRSTRFVSKMHVGRPKPSSNGSQSRHTPAAEEALIQLLQLGVNDDKGLERVLLSFGSKLWSPDDYSFLFRELGNREECWKAIQCFEFAVRKERRRNEQGKLASSMISVLGRLKRIDLARDVFETARSRGYGNTVYAYSALINAYGRCGCCDEAIMVFELMKKLGFFPNLVTYNAVIDACAKGGVDYPRVEEFFNEMLRNNVQPDRITYNSLLAVCSRVGKWEKAQALFSEMVEKGIDQDIFTYNTLLDAVCKGAQMDLAHEIMSAMPILPTVVTYSTMIGGYAKQGRFEEALGLFNEMKFLNIGSDRVLYNTLVSIYANLGRFEEAMNVCKEMENCGIEKDVVTYNALLGGYGKHGKYSVVRRLFKEMKAEQIYPNLLTYSTFIDVLSKGGLYSEAMEVFREFKQAGLKADVVLYTALIDALCKHGMVDSAISLVDDMVKEGIRPNVVTYNSIIDAFGWARAAECQVVAAAEAGKRDSTSTSSMVIKDAIDLEVGDREDNRIMKMLGKLATDKVVHLKKGKIDRQEILCILGIFQKMHQLKIKPNVVTFSAILNACSRCNLFEDASMLLDELRLLDNQVYGVAHGLLMDCRGNVWIEAQSLFDEMKMMDAPTASAFYNALTDMLWHFGQKKGAQLVVLEGKRRNVWEGTFTDSCLDLHMMSSGAARAMVHAWLLNIRAVVFEGRQLPKLLSILTGWGKHSKVVGDGMLRRTIAALLTGMGAPFQVAEYNIGRFISTGSVVAAWLKESGTLKVLVLHDDRVHPKDAKLDQITNLGALPL